MARKSSEAARYWHQTLRKEFEKETDRGAVIVVASMLDEALGTYLKSYLIPNASNEDKMFDGVNAPLSTFSSRIDMCHRLGLISPRFCRDLHLIRNIRNIFAHNVSGCSFEDGAVKSRLIELSRSIKLGENRPSIRKDYPDGAKGDFLLIAAAMLFEINDETEALSSLETKGEEYFYTIKKKDVDEGGKEADAS